MKTKYPNLFGILAALMLVASFVVPTSLVSPTSVAADPGICKWDTTREPGSLTGTEVIATNSDILDLAVGSDFNTLVAVVEEGLPTYVFAGAGRNSLFKWSNTKGLFWTASRYFNLTLTPGWSLPAVGVRNGTNRQIYNVAMAPDDPNFYAVTTDNASGTPNPRTGPREVFVTTNGGGSWLLSNLSIQLADNETIRSIDISVDYGGRRDIAVGTANGFGQGRVFVITSVGFAGWRDQQISASSLPAPLAAFNLGPVDFYAVKFSPSYASDASLAIVFADNTTLSVGACDNVTAANPPGTGATFYNVLTRDTALDTVTGVVFGIPGIEIKDNPWPIGASPGYVTLNKACLQLPSDFSGQAASLRRAYVSLDAFGAANKANCSRDGIFRIDDTSVYTLMDTSNIAQKSIYSIAYFGTYASGKLLAGERMGFPCTATVPTWFTDSPTTCPIPCWYPALKPTTGAAAVAGCTPISGQIGVGAAIVAWAPQGNLAYAATGSLAVVAGQYWYLPLMAPMVPLDESALAISRNNGETWNEISLIDTQINYFTDLAPTPDCKTLYLASTDNAAACSGFDSVWRSSINPDVTSPLAPQPVGTYWERVLTRVTSPRCDWAQTDWAILRLVPYCADPTGEIIAWGVYDPTNIYANQGIAGWSPDFGDYWAPITPRNAIQDFCFESRTVMYFLTPGGLVQKMPYTGTAWSSTYPSVDSILAFGAHTIAAYPEGKVMVGSSAAMNGAVCASSYCGNFNTESPAFAIQILSGRTLNQPGNVHVAFDPNFKDNSIYYIGVDAAAGSVFRNNPTAQLRWADTDMMAAANGAIGTPVGTPHATGQFGIALAFTGQALYSAHGGVPIGVDRTIDDGTGNFGPLSGMPKPGIAWDHLGTNLLATAFQAEPSSLKICGCCTLDTDSTLYALDSVWSLGGGGVKIYYSAALQTGLIWAFTDCMAKRGPALVTEDKTLIGCDPVSGRAQEINLCWEQLCIANAYDIEIGKDTNFTIKVIDWVTEAAPGGAATFLVPASLGSPCVYFPAGGVTNVVGIGGTPGSAIAAFGNLECGHTYFWRVKVRQCATTQIVRSPWSEVRSFTVKAGLPVVSTYLGLTLLAPNNGCVACPIKPASFSWSPFKETTKYKFQLASDAGMTQLVKEAEVLNSTAYEFDGELAYSTNYFWRVMSMEPAPSEWSATFSFQTEAKPVPVTPSAAAEKTPLWVWVVIAIGAILVIVTLVLIFKTRRV